MDLEIMKATAKAASVDDASLSWITSQVNSFFDSANVIVKLQAEVDTMCLDKLSTDLSQCDEELASDEKELSELLAKSLSMKDREKEISVLETRLRKMKADLAADKDKLKKKTEVKKRVQLKKQKKQRLEEQEVSAAAKIEELNLKKTLVQTTVNNLVSFAKSG